MTNNWSATRDLVWVNAARCMLWRPCPVLDRAIIAATQIDKILRLFFEQEMNYALIFDETPSKMPPV